MLFVILSFMDMLLIVSDVFINIFQTLNVLVY